MKQTAWKEIAKELDLENGKVVEQLWNNFLKKCSPNEVQNVCMPSLCFHERIFSSKFGDNISLVGMSWR